MNSEGNVPQDTQQALSGAPPALSTGRPSADRIAEIAFAPALIAWQRQHGRHDLPWQNTRDAYRIWLSEIMLQQTQVATVLPYYERFLQRYPDVGSLARAPQEEVLALWAGLGYYARARHLHRCAQRVASEHAAVFPTAPSVLCELPGIGRSTAAAIAVFSSGARSAILDGNVKRVLTRCFGIAGFPGQPRVERELWTLAERLLPVRDLESYTQGLMDLGATLCTRTRPRCKDCPLRTFCVARADNRTEELPTPKPTRAVPRRTSRPLVLRHQGQVLLEVRPPSGLWGGLWTLPECREDETPEAAAQRLAAHAGALLALPSFSHAFTHFRLDLAPFFADLANRPAMCAEEDRWRWLPLDQIGEAPLPTPVRRILEKLPPAPSGA
jgi:A/G-specific adenine glycosylase